MTVAQPTTRLRFTSRSPGRCGPMLDNVALATPAPTQTATTLDASPNPSVSGQSVTFTATVLGADPQATPTGTMQFRIDGVDAGAAVAVDAAGHATLATSALGVGSHTVAAVFQPGSAAFDTSQAQVVQQVDRAATDAAIALSPGRAVAGQPVTFTATVTARSPGAGTPTGTVQFTEADGTPIGQPQPLSAGRATLIASAGAGAYTIRANYSGDAGFSASSTSVDQVVARADTTTTIASDANPVAPGGEVTFTVVVKTTPPGGVPPTGSIAIVIDGQDVSGQVPLFDDGLATGVVAVTFTAPTTPQSASIAAVYSGDLDTNPSASPSFVQTVGSPPATSAAPIAPVAPASTTPATTSAPGGTTTRALRAMVAPLITALTRRGLAALDRTTETLTAAGPGTLTQSVYTPTTPPSLRRTAAQALQRKRPTLIASAKRTLAAAGRASLRLRTTSAGRRAIRSAKSLKLAIVTTFTPKTGAPVVLVSRLNAKRRATRGRAPRETARSTTWPTRTIHPDAVTTTVGHARSHPHQASLRASSRHGT